MSAPKLSQGTTRRLGFVAVTTAAWFAGFGLLSLSHGCGGTGDEGPTAGSKDATAGDAAADTGLVESSTDASRDAGSDAAGDAGSDAPSDASGDAPSDVASDANAGDVGGPCGDGGVETVGNADRPMSVAVDGTNICWTGMSSNLNVFRAPVGGRNGDQVVLAMSQVVIPGLAVDATNVYWAVRALTDAGLPGNNLVTVSLDGGSPTAIVSGLSGAPYVFATDALSVYWTNPNDGTVMKAPLHGGNATTLAAGQNSPGSGAIDATSVYWGTADGAVMKVPLSGGTPTTLASGQNNLSGIAVDASNIYWGAADGVWKARLGGGTPTKLASVAAVSVVADGSSVYWLGLGGVWKVPLGGGAPIQVAQVSPGSASSLAVDSACVYWVNYGLNSVQRAPK